MNVMRARVSFAAVIVSGLVGSACNSGAELPTSGCPMNLSGSCPASVEGLSCPNTQLAQVCTPCSQDGSYAMYPTYCTCKNGAWSCGGAVEQGLPVDCGPLTTYANSTCGKSAVDGAAE